MTNEHDRSLLLTLAREAIAAYLGGVPAHVPALTGALAQPGGAFVTLHSRGELRGCIGHIEPTDPIGRAVQQCAVAACSTDPRFPPVTAAELPQIDIEISLLGPLESITGPAEIEIGRHGLVVRRGWARGLLLPQVAVEWHWDADAFLSHTCHKAGLPNDAWKHGAKIWRFEAEVFGEEVQREK